MPILVINDRQGRQVYEITESRIFLGRSGENHVIIDDLKSSRRHCVIEKSKAGYHLQDLNSLNGTVLNGAFVEKSKLQYGDVVEIGEASIIFESSESKTNLGAVLKREKERKDPETRVNPAVKTRLPTRKVELKTPADLQEENKFLKKILDMIRSLSTELDLGRLLVCQVPLAHAHDRRGQLLVGHRLGQCAIELLQRADHHWPPINWASHGIRLRISSAVISARSWSVAPLAPATLPLLIRASTSPARLSRAPLIASTFASVSDVAAASTGALGSAFASLSAFMRRLCRSTISHTGRSASTVWRPRSS